MRTTNGDTNDELNFGYLGYSKTTRRILDGIDVEPELVISFEEHIQRDYGRNVDYGEYDTWVEIESINSEAAKEVVREHSIDVLLVMGWPELLDEETLDIPEIGCVGRHLSMLPKRRGRTPVAWALIHGMDETGVTLFWLDTGVDSGPIVNQWPVSISREDHANDLHEKCTDVTIEMLNEETLPAFREGRFPREPQDHSRATYTHPRRPDMGLIDWTDSATKCHNFIRGQSHPYPGAFTYHKMDKISLWKSSIEHPTRIVRKPGEVLGRTERDESDRWRVQCGEGEVSVKVENRGGSYEIEIGTRLGAVSY